MTMKLLLARLMARLLMMAPLGGLLVKTRLLVKARLLMQARLLMLTKTWGTNIGSIEGLTRHWLRVCIRLSRDAQPQAHY